ncbi:hypothetical protein RB601_004321 [Gaeumannomyces tritici]
MAVQAQWSLDTTPGSAISLLSDVIQAATTDNVQAIALLACERFGSTLAMSDETMSKMETSVVPTPPSIPIRFLQAKIGFSKHDSAVQLGKSKAGVRFLGLATALITTMEPMQAAKALDLMLSKSAADSTQLPTLRQLRDLLLALEPRCQTAGFADSVHGWELLVARDRSQRRRIRNCHPSPDCLELVVDSFRQIGRIGDAKITGVTIMTTRCGPWLVAFTKWCFGAPPSVYLEDGTRIIEQPQSLVEIFVMNEDYPRDAQFVVKVHHSLGGLSELVLPDACLPCLGMVSIDVFGQRLLDSFDRGIDECRQALVATLPYAICRALPNVSVKPFTEAGQDAQLASQLRISPFPERRAVERAMDLLLGLSNATKCRDLDENLVLKEIPAVRSFLDVCCLCEVCEPSRKATVRHCCEFGSFSTSLDLIISVVLGVSLFRWPEDLQLDIGYLESLRHPPPERISRSHPIPQDFSVWSPAKILECALNLVGHLGHKARGGYVASAMRGQVVYPSIFETSQIRKHGFLSFDHYRGKLMYKNDEYSSAVGHGQFVQGREHSGSDRTRLGRPVDGPCNLFVGCRVSWEVAVVADGELSVNMISTNAGKDIDSTNPRLSQNPAVVLMRADRIFMVENCGHDPSSPLTHPPSHQWQYAGVTGPRANDYEEDFRRGVVAIDGANDLRMFALAIERYDKLVIRERSCLSCCMEAAERLGAKIIIL